MIVITQILENQIALLKKCAEFYANEWGLNNLELDGGFIAKETLAAVKNLEEQSKSFSDQYEEKLPTTEDFLKEVQRIVDQHK